MAFLLTAEDALLASLEESLCERSYHCDEIVEAIRRLILLYVSSRAHDLAIVVDQFLHLAKCHGRFRLYGRLLLFQRLMNASEDDMAAKVLSNVIRDVREDLHRKRAELEPRSKRRNI